VLALALLLPLGWANDFVVEPYLQSATPDGIWILWESEDSEDADDVSVAWGATAALENTASTDRAATWSGVLHEAELTGLTPDTRYFYQVSDGDAVSPVVAFTTPPLADSEAAFRLVAMSDMQRDSSNPDKFEEIVEQGVIDFVAAEYGEALDEAIGLVLVPGDLVDSGWSYSQWADTYFAPAASLLGAVPSYPVPGNHEADTPYFFDYFHLPENGSEGYEEHWWYTDYSNLRVIGLDSNSGYRVDEQLSWLEVTLTDACVNDDIDFVFAQLHHPYLSELWLDGETDYTGDVISLLETFTTECGKPSIHFFGHTHGYSRGQSRDHAHLWVNVATAGGNIDYWGEYAQADYDEFSVSQDEWGFVLVEVEAGDEPAFRLRRVSRGDESLTLENEVRDEVSVRRYNSQPDPPTPLSPLGEAGDPDCVVLAGSAFADADGDAQGGVHWQVSASCEDFGEPLVDRWYNHENWYLGEDTLAGIDLSREAVTGLAPERALCWRVRYRDRGLIWSDWSAPAAFTTGLTTRSENLLINGDAESGTDGWTVDGVMESLTAGQCGGADPYEGDHYFSVGGLCDETAYSEAVQRVDLSDRAAAVDAGASVSFGGYLRDWSGSDHPEMAVAFYDEAGTELTRGEPVGTLADEWTRVEQTMAIPEGARAAELVLMGTRGSGSDNDSYFDALWLTISEACPVADPDEPGDTGEPDTGTPADTAEDTAEDTAPDDTTPPGDSDPPERDTAGGEASGAPTDEVKADCGCGGGGAGGFWFLGALLLARRRDE